MSETGTAGRTNETPNNEVHADALPGPVTGDHCVQLIAQENGTETESAENQDDPHLMLDVDVPLEAPPANNPDPLPGPPINDLFSPDHGEQGNAVGFGGNNELNNNLQEVVNGPIDPMNNRDV